MYIWGFGDTFTNYDFGGGTTQEQLMFLLTRQMPRQRGCNSSCVFAIQGFVEHIVGGIIVKSPYQRRDQSPFLDSGLKRSLTQT